jgi:hypothetical protein
MAAFVAALAFVLFYSYVTKLRRTARTVSAVGVEEPSAAIPDKGPIP